VVPRIGVEPRHGCSALSAQQALPAQQALSPPQADCLPGTPVVAPAVGVAVEADDPDDPPEGRGVVLRPGRGRAVRVTTGREGSVSRNCTSEGREPSAAARAW
jgi:hypothetical protein